MSTRARRLAGAALSLGLLLFAHSTNAEMSARGMLEEVFNLLNAAQQSLSQDPLSPSDKQRALGQIHEAMDIVTHVPVN
jgi:hypothetical protein